MKNAEIKQAVQQAEKAEKAEQAAQQAEQKEQEYLQWMRDQGFAIAEEHNQMGEGMYEI